MQEDIYVKIRMFPFCMFVHSCAMSQGFYLLVYYYLLYKHELHVFRWDKDMFVCVCVCVCVHLFVHPFGACCSDDLFLVGYIHALVWRSTCGWGCGPGWDDCTGTLFEQMHSLSTTTASGLITSNAD